MSAAKLPALASRAEITETASGRLDRKIGSRGRVRRNPCRKPGRNVRVPKIVVIEQKCLLVTTVIAERLRDKQKNIIEARFFDAHG